MGIDQVRMWTTGEYDLAGITLQDFQFKINLNRDSLPWTWTHWCKENCQHRWAWWFDNKMCYVGFMDKEEACLFTLLFVGNNGTEQ